MHGKTMKEALMEVRSFRDTSDIKEVKLGFMARNRELAKLPKPIIPQPPIMPVTKEGGPGSGPQKGGKKFSDKQIKQAYGILNDPRYKQGNFSGAAKAIDKLSPGLSDHPDVKNAMKRANEALDLPATGDTTTSNASQEDLEEGSINEILPALAVGAAAAATGAAAYKAGGAIYKGVSKIKKNLSNYGKRTSNPAGESVDEAKLSTAQLDTLKQKYSGLKGSEKNGIQMDKLAKIMKRYPESMLDQLAGLDIPMVSKVAKAMTEEVAEGGPGSGPQKDGGSSKSDSEAEYKKTQDKEYKRLTGLRKKEQERQKASKGDYKKSSKAALALKKYKSKFSHLKNDPLKIPGASQHQKSGKNVRMNKVPKKFGGEYYDQEDREELAHRVKFHHLGGKSFAGAPPSWQLKKYGVTDDGKLKKDFKPDDQLKA